MSVLKIKDANGNWQNIPAIKGADGINGTNGVDGISPIATVSKSGDTATISITDKNGTTTATVKDGQDGINGTNGRDGYVQYTAGDNITIDENNVISATGGDCNLPVIDLKTQGGSYTDPIGQAQATKIINDCYQNGIDACCILLRGAVYSAKSYIAYLSRYAHLTTQQENYIFYCCKPDESNSIYLGIEFRIMGTWSNNVFTCTSLSISGQGTSYQFSNYLAKNNTSTYTPTANYHPATKKYVDDNKGQTIQYDTMPTAGSNLEGKIVQYIGTTDSTYTNGYFYKCVSDGEETPTYSWEEIEVQDGGDLSDYYTKSETQALRNVFAYNLSSGDLLTSNSFTHTITDTNFLDFFNANENKSMSLILNDNYGNAAFIPFATYTNTKAFILSDAQNDWIGSRLIRINRTKTSGKITSVTITTNSYPFSGVVKYASESNVLLKNNTSSYTPTGNYNPATKKYVDDSIASAITTTLQGGY